MKGDIGRLDPQQKEKYRNNYDTIKWRSTKELEMGCKKKGKGGKKK
jgi:hypothetical protein